MTKERFLSDLLSRMSVEEKVGQLNLLTGAMDATGIKHSTDLVEKIRGGACGALMNVFTPAATRAMQEVALESALQIPLLFGYDVIHGHRTIFPIPLGLSCSWNFDLIECCARAAAAEAAADGLHWVFSPMVDISQDPRWGRVAEGSGEDPWLGAKIASAMVRGYQGKNLADPSAVLACVKHFALYGAVKAGRDYHHVDMSRREMEETYFPPYRAAIDAGARTVMTAFNEVDGIPASSNRWLLTQILRERWKFQGWIVTDYTAISEMKNHGTAATDASAAEQSFTAGVDMDMISECFINELPSMVKSGVISETQLDTAVMRILGSKWDLGLFADPFARCDEQRAAITHLCTEHRNLAREAARESLVLLQNHDHLLPLAKSGTIAVLGPLSDDRRAMLGCWIAAGDENDVVSPLQGIREAVGENSTIVTEITGHVDVIILILGESHEMYGEAACKTDIRLPKSQRKLAKRIFKLGKPCVLVTISGRPLELSKVAARFPTMLHGWAPGIEAGRALADVIFAEFSPVGKLTMGFPRSVGQLPMTYREKPGGRPFDALENYTSKYLDSSNDALFPFGHGLTYGKFHLGELIVCPPEMQAGAAVQISAELHNLSSQPATETLQLYLRDSVASVTRPIKELRGFQRITLAAGEKRIVTFEITEQDLSFPTADVQPMIEPGEFVAMIGFSSADLRSVKFSSSGQL